MNRFLKLAAASLLFAGASAQATTVVLDILFDEFPNETAFGLWDISNAPSIDDLSTGSVDPFTGIAYNPDLSSPIGFGDGFVLPGDFAGEGPGPWQFVWNVNPGTYFFAITDTFGDGICCEFGDGTFSLTVDGDVVISGGAFSSFAGAKFEGTTPIPVPGALILFGSALAGWFGFGRRATAS